MLKQPQDFLNPHTISYVIILNQYQNCPGFEQQQDPFTLYLTEKLITLDKDEPVANYRVFYEQMQRENNHIPEILTYVKEYKEQPDQQNMNTNKVNHCVLNKASINFDMGFLDESLRCLAEALRISQNNSDDESINYCLIYLYHITSSLGRYQDAISILEHSLLHSFTIQNPLLQLYNCMNYQNYHSLYDLPCKEEFIQKKQNPKTNVLIQKNIIWYELVHQAINKLSSFYEQSVGMKMINKESFLDIPITSYKLSLANIVLDFQQPHLCQLIYSSRRMISPNTFNSVKCTNYLLQLADKSYEYNPLTSLEILEQIEEKNKIKNPQIIFYTYLINFRSYLNRVDLEKSAYFLQEMKNLLEFTNDPLLYAKYLRCQGLQQMKQKRYNQALFTIKLSIKFCKKRGFKRQAYLQQKLDLAILQYKLQHWLPALNQFGHIYKLAKQKELYNMAALARIYMSLSLNQLGNLVKPLHFIKKIEENWLGNLPISSIAFFFKAKSSLLLSVAASLDEQSQLQLRQDVYFQALHCLNKSLESYINLNFLEEIQDIYYLQARIYNELNKIEHREVASHYFIVSQELMQFYQNGSNNTVNEGAVYGQLIMQDSSIIQIQKELFQLIPQTFQIIQVPQQAK